MKKVLSRIWRDGCEPRLGQELRTVEWRLKREITEIKKRRVFVFNFLLWKIFKTCTELQRMV